MAVDPSTVVTFGALTQIVDGLVDIVREKLEAKDARIKTLEDRLAEAEQQRAMHFRGAHDPGETYKRGACVQRSNSLFVAMTDTGETPGASSSWRKLA